MYNPRDIQFVGKHDYNKERVFAGVGHKTFSVGIFKWRLKKNGRQMKKGKSIVRVSGPIAKADRVFKMADFIVSSLDNNNWDGRKTVRIK